MWLMKFEIAAKVLIQSYFEFGSVLTLSSFKSFEHFILRNTGHEPQILNELISHSEMADPYGSHRSHAGVSIL